jgi:hypothetical protein
MIAANCSCSWPRSLRLAILYHLVTMDINIHLLLDVVETYRLNLKVEERIETVRALDILGAERSSKFLRSLEDLRMGFSFFNNNC